MSLYKRNGVWYGRVKVDGAWRAKTLNTADRKVADVRYRELERSSVDPTYRAANETSFAAAVEAFDLSRRVKGCAEGTMQMYATKCKHLTSFFGKGLPLAALQPPQGAARVDRYVAGRLEAGATRNTIGKELTALRGILKVAKRAGKYEGDLDAVLPTEWSTDYEPRRTALTPAQVDTLVTYLAKPRPTERVPAVNRAAFVAFVVATGARLSEALRATRRQVDMKAGLVHFEITKTRKKGKREKYVPITALTRPLLEHALAATAGRGKLFDPWSNVVRDLADACEGAGVPKVTPNDLRRTHANWLRNAGVDTTSIADVLGHTDSRMVEKVYGKLRKEQLRDRVVAVVNGVH